MKRTKIIAEIGINYAFGERKDEFLSNAKQLIMIAAAADCDFVKFQKRNPDLAVPEAQKNKEKVVPWREEPTTYLQYKKDVEFQAKEYAVLKEYAENFGIRLFASVWDLDSATFMRDFSPIVKIPSAKLTDEELLKYCRNEFPIKILSTGMSTEEEIERAVELLDPHVIMHTNSVYPTPLKDLNFGYIDWLVERWQPNIEIGYSSHYFGIQDASIAIAKRATWIEKHITLRHEFWGSDQKSSVEPQGLFKMVRQIRDFEKILDEGYKPRELYPGEEKKKASLRG